MKQLIENACNKVREQHPLVHSITNYVTVNDCANVVLGIGASPIMADDLEEVEEIVSICNSLVLNLGTLNKRTIQAMHLAAKKAATLEIPIVFDPVGAGASKLRTQTALEILERYPIAICRGNMSELAALSGLNASTRGVDVSLADAISEENRFEKAELAQRFAQHYNTTLAITGALDIVANENEVVAVRNGSAMQGIVTGCGCMISCVSGAYAAANKDNLFAAALGSIVHGGLAGQLAEKRMNPKLDGNGSFRTYLLDAFYTINGTYLAEHALLERL